MFFRFAKNAPAGLVHRMTVPSYHGRTVWPALNVEFADRLLDLSRATGDDNYFTQAAMTLRQYGTMSKQRAAIRNCLTLRENLIEHGSIGALSPIHGSPASLRFGAKHSARRSAKCQNKKICHSLRKTTGDANGALFKKNASLICGAGVTALLITIAWYVIWTSGIHFADEADMDSIITTLGVTYGIIATWVLDTIWDKYKKVVVSTLHQDKDEFMLYRDERLPTARYFLVIFVSLPLLGMIGMIDYQNVPTGIFSVFAVSFILSLFWIVIKHLEDPSRSAWIAERIPADWLETDIDEHFHLDQHKERF